MAVQPMATAMTALASTGGLLRYFDDTKRLRREGREGLSRATARTDGVIRRSGSRESTTKPEIPQGGVLIPRLPLRHVAHVRLELAVLARLCLPLKQDEVAYIYL